MHGVGRVNTQTQTKNAKVTRTSVVNIRDLKPAFLSYKNEFRIVKLLVLLKFHQQSLQQLY